MRGASFKASLAREWFMLRTTITLYAVVAPIGVRISGPAHRRK